MLRTGLCAYNSNPAKPNRSICSKCQTKTHAKLLGCMHGVSSQSCWHLDHDLCAVSTQIATYKICAVRMGDSKDSGEVEVPLEVAGLPPPGGDAKSDGSVTVPLHEVPPGDLGNDNPQVSVIQSRSWQTTPQLLPCCLQLLPRLPCMVPPTAPTVCDHASVEELISSSTACCCAHYATCSAVMTRRCNCPASTSAAVSLVNVLCWADGAAAAWLPRFRQPSPHAIG